MISYRVRGVARAIALLLAAALAASACGSERDLDQESFVGLEPGTFVDSLTPCGEADAPVAAFWGSDEGVGQPGRGPGSPDGGDIWTIAADGRVAAVTDDARSRDPSLSSDGRRLYFNRSPGGTRAGSAAPGTEAWVMNLETGDETMLFEVSDPELEHIERLVESPDGTSIVYSAALGPADEARARLYLIDRHDPTAPTQLPTPPGQMFNRQVEPAWSPDGRLLAYLFAESGDGFSTTWSVRIFEPATSADRVLYTNPQAIRMDDLHWSADGTKLLVTEEAPSNANGGEGFNRLAVSIDGATGARLDSTGVSLDATYTSSDGSTIGAIGLPPNFRTDPSAEPAVVTWRLHTGSEAPIIAALPVGFAFATDLAIAPCALPPFG